MGTTPGSLPLVVVVMGVSGAGKSTVGEQLAERIGAHFVEGDQLHPAENVARMAAGDPLDDDDRRPWLDAISEVIADHHRRHERVVIACSALRRRYRDRLRRAGDVTFVLLEVPPEVLAVRVAERRHDFMPSSLLDDQLASLELPAADEADVVVVAAAADPGRTTDLVRERLAPTA